MSHDLRLLTLNAWLLRWGRLRVARDFAARQAALPEAAAATGADLVALQEIWPPETARDLEGRFRALGYEHVAVGARRRGPRLLGSGLMLLSRHPLRDARQLAFRGRSAWYEHLIAKGALRAAAVLPGGAVLHVATAHLGVVRFDLRRGAFREDDAATRRAQLEQLADWLDAVPADEPLVVAGDLNLTDRPFADGRYREEPAPDYRRFLDRLRLVDAYRQHDAAGPGFTFDPAANAHAARGRCRELPGQRIDYVLYRDGNGIASAGTELVLRAPPLLSDHWGVLARLTVTGARRSPPAPPAP